MRTNFDITNHAATPNLSWCAPAMPTLTKQLVPAVACTKIRPVVASGGPSEGGSS